MRRYATGRIWLVSLLLLLGCFQAPLGRARSAATAPDSPATPAQFKIEPLTDNEPGYFSVELEPGASASLTVYIGMTADGLGNIALVFKADVFTQTNGGFAVRRFEDPPTGPTTWLDFETRTYDFEPGEGVERTFTITVPPETPPGEYVTALVVQNGEPVEIANNIMFDQVVRWALPVLITVLGPADVRIELGDPSITIESAMQMLVIPMLNSGNRIVRPRGAITFVESETGLTVATAPVEMGSVYPGHETTLQIQLREPLPTGSYRVELELADQARGLPPLGWVGTLDAPDPATALAPPPVSITDVALLPKPTAEQVQYLDVTLSIVNRGEPVAQARVTLRIERDGALVEEYPLATSVALPAGATTLQQRYIPIDGWTTGRYHFSLLIESIDPLNGVATVLARHQIGDALIVT